MSVPIALETSESVQSIPFIRTELEWAARNKDQILRAASVTGTGNTTLFVVPANKVLWITNVACNVRTGVGAGNAEVRTIQGGNFVNRLILVECAPNRDNFGQRAFAMPIKINPGETVEIGHGVVTLAFASLEGYLDDLVIT